MLMLKKILNSPWFCFPLMVIALIVFMEFGFVFVNKLNSNYSVQSSGSTVKVPDLP